jgi:hypothetical protein
MPDVRHALVVRRLDRLIVAAALVLVAVVAVDALRGHGGSSRSSQSSFPQPTSTTVATTKNSTQVQVVEQSSSLGEAPVPSLVRLIPSSTAFLPNCPTRTLALRVVPGPALQLHFMGSRCHVPPLHLHAVVRDSRGRVVYAGLALAHEGLSGNYAGEGVTRAPLVVGCRSTPLFATVTGSGLTADGPIRCRGDR